MPASLSRASIAKPFKLHRHRGYISHDAETSAYRMCNLQSRNYRAQATVQQAK